MKRIHLLCNAHLDPVWLWGREEGIAEAISTFRVAAKFCEEYDGFIFNHNESVLYEWVEEHEPELFKKIQKLVKEGKWHIMGGWYLQPDCVMPSGEGFLRQIETGNTYFMEKFGVKPTTAINFDPFGHSRGLVQILRKSGYDSYLFMRPHSVVGERTDFIWKGFDGSEIIAHSMNGGYNSGKGKAVQKLEGFIENRAKDGLNLMLWGIGNHGGGPSKIDLNNLTEYIANHPENEIFHSYCENYFAEVERDLLDTFEKSLVHCMVGCYTSMNRIKKTYRQLENDLVRCEKMLAASGVDYDKQQLKDAEKALLFSQFHDILPGSMIKAGEEEILRLLNSGLETTAKFRTRAFFRLCSGQPQAKDGEIPVLVFNPHPYRITREVEVEFQLADQNWNDNEVTLVRVRDKNGNYLKCQNEKEACSFSLDWRKKIVFTAELEPMSINRFDCELWVENSPFRPIAPCSENGGKFTVKTERLEVHINKATGLIDKYCVDGVDLLTENSAKITAYKDNEDPWGMTVDSFTARIGEFTLLSDEEANAFAGYPDASHGNVRVIENGDVRCKIQAIAKHKNSFAVITYIVPKNDVYIDIHIKLLSNDVNTLYKLSFDSPMSDPDFVGQTAFGFEKMIKEEKEVTYQKWCGFAGGFAVINNCTYAGSANAGKLNVTLCRTPVYSAHPIRSNRPLAVDDRHHDHIDIGEREYEYRLLPFDGALDMEAEIFNQPPLALSFFPSGAGEKRETALEISNPSIILSAYKTYGEAKLIRLYNASQEANTTEILIDGKTHTVSFGAFEVKAFIADYSGIRETNLIGQ